MLEIEWNRKKRRQYKNFYKACHHLKLKISTYLVQLLNKESFLSVELRSTYQSQQAHFAIKAS
ncbi:hypothetical protein D9981_03400 [Pseudoalteromonas phenolica O-BC30]|nr:hypothetical protein [Pseudoalteromonas phenolica O-BC30]RXF04922.1 hypothetical protein D9981_03400 [Pseudoalteromonas phenolica O-BC30]